MDAGVKNGLKDIGGRNRVGFLEFVNSDELALIQPIELYLQYESGYRHWVASFCRAATSATGETPGQAIEELRNLLTLIHESRVMEEKLPEPWRSFSPQLLGALDEHFARKTADA